jgi:competence protein ComEC
MTERLGATASVEVLHPDDPTRTSVNDASLVFRLRFGATTVLFTGDIEHGAEQGLLADRDRLRSDVLKVPHHGSATSSTATWLAAVAPKVAVVSSGADNRFGFPAPAVVRRLRAGGASVWNTAEHGAVRVVSDGRTLHVTAMRPPKPERFEFPQLLW